MKSFRWILLGLVLAGVTTAVRADDPPPGTTERYIRWSEKMKNDFRFRMMPFWYDNTIDTVNGGYVLAESVDGDAVAQDKMIVSQVEMLYGFSLAHVKGFGTPERDYKKAAQQGYEFIRDHFQDTLYGGYFTSTSLSGDPIDRSKSLYTQSVVMYCFLNYFRATADVRARNDAIRLFDLIQKHAHDSRKNGWFEHFDEDWEVITEPTTGRYTEGLPGLKSGKAHMYWMEALTLLYKEYPNAKVKQALAECLEVNKKHFFPKDPTKFAFYRYPDWVAVNSRNTQISYGQNVQFAWLMIEAERALDRERSWDHFDAILNHALEYGFDHQLGGLYEQGGLQGPAQLTDKQWWAQAEMMAALTMGLRKHVRPERGVALEQLNGFIWAYMVQPETGMWLNTVTAAGSIVDPSLADNRKAAFHDIRAMVRFYETFAIGEKYNFSWPPSVRPHYNP